MPHKANQESQAEPPQRVSLCFDVDILSKFCMYEIYFGVVVNLIVYCFSVNISPKYNKAQVALY